MRLTSYNIAVKRLNAGCCLSDLVARMWEYMEEGDVKNAQCVREKALVLSGLIKALERWHPTITEGFTTEVETDFSTITYPDPYIHISSSVNGRSVIRSFFAYGGNSEILDGLISSPSCDNDDIIQLKFLRTGEETATITVTSSEELYALSNVNSTAISGSVTRTYVNPNEPFSGVSPNCLSNTQVLSIIKKIDELCGCNC